MVREVGASRSPHRVGQQNSAPLSLARRAVRAHDATAGRARPTRLLPWGSTSSAADATAAFPEVAEHP